MTFHVKCSICGYVDTLAKKEYIDNYKKPAGTILGMIVCPNCKCHAVVKPEHLSCSEENEW